MKISSFLIFLNSSIFHEDTGIISVEVVRMLKKNPRTVNARQERDRS